MNSNDVKDQDASIETGLAGFKINLKNELEGTNKTLFAGKFKVEKFHVGVVDLPKFKNNFSYYVNYDWNLPIGYVYGYDGMDVRAGNRPSETEARLTFVTWFKGDPKNLDYGKYVAYLYYQGKMVADSAGGGDKYGNTGCEVTNTCITNRRTATVAGSLPSTRWSGTSSRSFIRRISRCTRIRASMKSKFWRTASSRAPQSSPWVRTTNSLIRESASRTIWAQAASLCRCKSSAIRMARGIATRTRLTRSSAIP